ncbi:MAG: hydroxymethylglutaryl-CoA synthase [Legionella sp.]|nr:hydroxymethylglutaryl-CoA synthase [Legionella sp.]
MANLKTGISSLGIHFPPLVMSVEELAKLRNIDPDKYLIGLGCKKIAMCPEDFNVVDLAVEAASRALSRWKGNIKDIGLLAVGTESAVDMSRPLSAYVADRLGIYGNVRSYEVKHACYGGTLALRQAMEWKHSGMAPGKAALIIATDISLYKPGDAGEPTQGAGAVAFIIDSPDIAEIDLISYPWSRPVFDFWRPMEESFPLVDGNLSIESYKEAAIECFKALLQDQNISLQQLFDQYHACCFHSPFTKMVKKAFYAVCANHGFDEQQSDALFSEKVLPSMEWNALSGNSYTASLWVGVAKALCGAAMGKKIAAFSYGSGCGAELLTLTAGEQAESCAWMEDVVNDFAKRKEITAEEYSVLRKVK